MSQLSTLAAHFSRPGISLTQREAAIMLGIPALSQRIGEMTRRLGFQFHHEMIPAPSRHGAARVAKYTVTAIPKREGV